MFLINMSRALPHFHLRVPGKIVQALVLVVMQTGATEDVAEAVDMRNKSPPDWVAVKACSWSLDHNKNPCFLAKATLASYSSRFSKDS